MAQKWVNRRQVANEYGLSLRTIDRMIESGKLRAYRVGGTVRIKTADAEALARPIASAGAR